MKRMVFLVNNCNTWLKCVPLCLLLFYRIMNKANSSKTSVILCDYSSSSEEDEQSNTKESNVKSPKTLSNDHSGKPWPPAKRFCQEKYGSNILPSVPSSICSMYEESENWLNGPPASSQNINIHDKRVRSFAHTRGNWATSVFVKVPTHVFTDELSEIQQWLASKVKELLKTKEINSSKTVRTESFEKVHLEVEPHISLTKVGVILQLHWIQPFVSSLRTAFSGMRTFYVKFGDVQIFLNEAKTRIFIGLEVVAEQLLRAVCSIDEVLKDYNQPEFYKPPKFHVSLLWCLGRTDPEIDKTDETEKEASENFEVELCELAQELNQEFDAALKAEELELTGFWVDQVTIKTGNKVFQFDLDAA